MRLQIPGVKTRQFLSARDLPNYMFHYLTFVTGLHPCSMNTWKEQHHD
jgi:hypothetical protein